MTVDESILALIRAEVARLVRPEALTLESGEPDDLALHERAQVAAGRLRRARRGGGR